MFRFQTGVTTVGKPKPTLFHLLFRQLQAFLAPDAFDSLQFREAAVAAKMEKCAGCGKFGFASLPTLCYC